MNLFTHLGNLIKTYFGTEYLADVHASLNNADHLRYYVDKIQKEIHPQGHGLLGVVYNYSRNINNFCEYVKRLGNTTRDKRKCSSFILFLFLYYLTNFKINFEILQNFLKIIK